MTVVSAKKLIDLISDLVVNLIVTESVLRAVHASEKVVKKILRVCEENLACQEG